jgi:hypothetical protein
MQNLVDRLIPGLESPPGDSHPTAGPRLAPGHASPPAASPRAAATRRPDASSAPVARKPPVLPTDPPAPCPTCGSAIVWVDPYRRGHCPACHPPRAVAMARGRAILVVTADGPAWSDLADEQAVHHLGPQARRPQTADEAWLEWRDAMFEVPEQVWELALDPDSGLPHGRTPLVQFARGPSDGSPAATPPDAASANAATDIATKQPRAGTRAPAKRKWNPLGPGRRR